MSLAANIELKARLGDLEKARETARRVATKILDPMQQTDTYFHCPQGRMKLREIVELPGERAELVRSAAEKAIGKPCAVAPSKCLPAGKAAKRRKAQLVWYDRADDSEAKRSDYRLTEICDPDRVRQLKTEMGIRVVVEKRREVFLKDNVRIHLDQVAKLGTFIEFEAVLGPDVNPAEGRAQVEQLEREFGIGPDDLVAKSYADLLLEISSI